MYKFGCKFIQNEAKHYILSVYCLSVLVSFLFLIFFLYHNGVFGLIYYDRVVSMLIHTRQ